MVSWLDAAIRERRGFELGELRVEPVADGWEIRGPRSERDSPGCRIAATDTETLRRHVQCDDAGHYRPLTGSRSLPSGWHAMATDDSALRTALDVVYPLAAHHIGQATAGTLRVVGLDAVLERQSGRYASAATLSKTGRSLATEVICGQCVRKPSWAGAQAAIGDRGKASTPIAGTIPCPEPCSIMVSFCREAAEWESSMPPGAAPDPAVGFAAFETPGNAIREAWLTRAFMARSEEEEN